MRTKLLLALTTFRHVISKNIKVTFLDYEKHKISNSAVTYKVLQLPQTTVELQTTHTFQFTRKHRNKCAIFSQI